jgi:predicted nuclease of restriction endonuclease-like RecB superfamily
LLTSDLIRVRRRGDKVSPLYLQPKQMEAAMPLVEGLIEVFQSSVGSTMADLDEAVREVSAAETDRVRVAGFVKLLRDRCDFETTPDVDPAELRAQVFGLASLRRRELGIRDAFDRALVLDACASDRGVSPERLEAMLFADLPGAQTLQAMRPVAALELLQRYNLALAQGVLLRATRVTIRLAPTTAPRVRQLLRAMKFRRLMYRINGTAQAGYEIVLDGPMSLFESTQRYGLQLALFLPVLVASDGWTLEAQLRWGKERENATFCMSDQEGLVSHYRKDATELDEIGVLVDTFSRLTSPWRVRRTSRIFHVKGQTVFVPDLVFEKEETKQRVYLEAFGYWNRDAVFDRVETLRRGLGERFLLAVSKKLRVSAEVAADDFPGRILVYGSAISANTVRRMLDEIVADG